MKFKSCITRGLTKYVSRQCQPHLFAAVLLQIGDYSLEVVLHAPEVIDLEKIIDGFHATSLRRAKGMIGVKLPAVAR